MTQFEGKFGALTCRALTNCNLDTPDGQAQFYDTNQLEQCLDYAGEAARLALHLGIK